MQQKNKEESRACTVCFTPENDKISLTESNGMRICAKCANMIPSAIKTLTGREDLSSSHLSESDVAKVIEIMRLAQAEEIGIGRRKKVKKSAIMPLGLLQNNELDKATKLEESASKFEKPAHEIESKISRRRRHTRSPSKRDKDAEELEDVQRLNSRVNRRLTNKRLSQAQHSVRSTTIEENGESIQQGQVNDTDMPKDRKIYASDRSDMQKSISMDNVIRLKKIVARRSRARRLRRMRGKMKSASGVQTTPTIETNNSSDAHSKTREYAKLSIPSFRPNMKRKDRNSTRSANRSSKLVDAANDIEEHFLHDEKIRQEQVGMERQIHKKHLKDRLEKQRHTKDDSVHTVNAQRISL